MFKTSLNIIRQNKITRVANELPICVRLNQPHATLTNTWLSEVFGMQLYWNDARALLSRILNILNLDWLLHACSVRTVYE